MVTEYVFLLWISISELILRSRIKYEPKEKQMASQRRILIAALVATLIVFATVVTIVRVLALLTTSKTVPSSGTVVKQSEAKPWSDLRIPSIFRNYLTRFSFGAVGASSGDSLI